MPKVSVLLPNYNNAPYLREAIESILNQTFTDFEFIIVDDGSTDNSVEIINSYNDSRIVLIEKDFNSGIVDSLNIGIDVAKGEFMVRMDGDDISTLDRIENLLRFMNENPSIGVCSSAIQNFGMSEQIWSFESDYLRNKAELLFGQKVGHASSIFRMSLFKKNNIRYRNFYPFVEDYKLFTELNKATKLSSISDVLYMYRRLPHTSTISNKDTFRERIGIIHKEVLNKLLGRLPTNEELNIHFDFYKAIYRLKLQDYYKWSKVLISANEQNNIYPSKELKLVIKQKLDKLKYKSLDNSKSNIWIIFRKDLTIKMSFVRYLIGKESTKK